MASLILKQIERGTVLFAAADTTKTVTLATALTDTAKTVLLFSSKSNSSDSVNYQVLGRVLSTTQIQFERIGSPSFACTVEYQVIEFTQGITVQHFYFSQTSGTINTTITAVTLAKAFPIITIAQSGTSFGANDLMSAEITTTTNLQTIMSNFSTCPVAVQVVEIDDAAVQKLKPAAWTTGATLNVTVTTIDPAKTFWFFSLTDNTSANCDQWPYCSYVNSTTLRFTKNYSGSFGSKDIVLYVVSLSNGVAVQNISTVIASGASSVSPAITTVVLAKTALLLNGIYQHLASSGEADDDGGDGAFALTNLTATQFDALRGGTPAYDATTNVQVLEFTNPNWFLLPNKNSVFNDTLLNGVR